MTSPLYGSQLASVHHAHFGSLAREAATELLARLTARGHRSGTIVELACGGGLSCEILSDAGYDVLGVDLSEAMLELARRHVPGAHFEQGSLWDFELPNAVAVTAVGEAFCYHGGGQRPDGELLGERFRSIASALPTGGILLFDVATPGRSGSSAHRTGSWEAAGTYLYLDEREHVALGKLTRTIDCFVPIGDLYRRDREVHELTTFDAKVVEARLRDAGFDYERTAGFGGYEFSPGWVGFVAVKARP